MEDEDNDIWESVRKRLETLDIRACEASFSADKENILRLIGGQIDELNENVTKLGEDARNTHMLMTAVRNGKIEEVRQLCQDSDHSATAVPPVRQLCVADRSDFSGATALHVAAANNQVAITQFFLETAVFKADVLDTTKRTPLDLICLQNAYSAVETSRVTAAVLIEHRADVNHPDDHGATPLMRAAFKGRLELVDLLCRAKADVNQAKADGKTALIWSAQSNWDAKVCGQDSVLINSYSDITRLLLEKDAKVDDQEATGFTALCLASKTGAVEVAKVLLEYNASVLLPTKETPLSLAMAKLSATKPDAATYYSNQAMVTLLEAAGAR